MVLSSCLILRSLKIENIIQSIKEEYPASQKEYIYSRSYNSPRVCLQDEIHNTILVESLRLERKKEIDFRNK